MCLPEKVLPDFVQVGNFRGKLFYKEMKEQKEKEEKEKAAQDLPDNEDTDLIRVMEDLGSGKQNDEGKKIPSQDHGKDKGGPSIFDSEEENEENERDRTFSKTNDTDDTEKEDGEGDPWSVVGPGGKVSPQKGDSQQRPSKTRTYSRSNRESRESSPNNAGRKPRTTAKQQLDDITKFLNRRASSANAKRDREDGAEGAANNSKKQNITK